MNNSKFSQMIYGDKSHKTVFLLLLILLCFDRILTLINFGFNYTDLDQIILWNGATDYAKGIFYEPFFYGQPYNYMVEALAAVPMLWFGALPITTVIISIFPFIFLAFVFKKYEYHFWAIICLALPLVLPLEFSLLTTISRGFIQAHLFLPFLFLPLLDPLRPRNVTILCIFSAISIVMNPSAGILVGPLFLYVYSYHFKSVSFYVKGLLVVPFFVIDFLAKHHYKIHPEKVLHSLAGLKLNADTFKSCWTNPDLFEFVFPYPLIVAVVLLFCLVFAVIRLKEKALIFVTVCSVLLILTFAIPKVQDVYENAGVFFASSRFYLWLPLLLLIAMFLLFRDSKFSIWTYFIPLVVGVFGFGLKNYHLESKIETVINETSFPVIEIADLQDKIQNLYTLTEAHDVDLILTSNIAYFAHFFENYAWYPLMEQIVPSNKVNAVMIQGDRRTWLYQDAAPAETILLNGFRLDDSLLSRFDYELLSENRLLIKLEKEDKVAFFNSLDLKYGLSK